MNRYQAIVDAPFPPPFSCLLGIRLDDGLLVGIDYIFSNIERRSPATPLAREVIRQLDGYFHNADHRFDLPVELRGTAFQLRVWQVLAAIPLGERWTYGAISTRLNSSPRAVGNACRSNPLPLVVPCHRVVSVSGLGGYDGRTSGSYISIKRWLLAHETEYSRYCRGRSRRD